MKKIILILVLLILTTTTASAVPIQGQWGILNSDTRGTFSGSQNHSIIQGTIQIHTLTANFKLILHSDGTFLCIGTMGTFRQVLEGHYFKYPGGYLAITQFHGKILWFITT